MKLLGILLMVGLVVPALAQNDRRQRGMMRGPDRSPSIGETAPDFTLEALNSEEEVTLSDLYQDKPVVLTLGSYTCPPFRKALEGMEELYQQYSNEFAFVFVYIKEAHATDERPSRANEHQDIKFTQPTTYRERSRIAATCQGAVELTMPIVVDTLENEVEQTYAAAPNRTYLIGKDGRILFKGVRGPRGTRPDDVEQAMLRTCLWD